MRVLTTGAGSGLGRFLRERLGGEALVRSTPETELERLRRRGADLLIHCAFRRAAEPAPEELADYLEDTLLLTSRVAAIPHRKLVFISTVDVYPPRGPATEDRPIPPGLLRGLYPLTKLQCEALVRRASPDHLILRCGALLGPGCRLNSLLRMAREEPRRLTLSGRSSFNYVRYQDVLDFIRLAAERELSGTYNIASSANITLAQAAALLGRRVRFGRHLYRTRRVDNRKAAALLPGLRATSRQVIVDFLEGRHA